jgi:hypothetical protein
MEKRTLIEASKFDAVLSAEIKAERELAFLEMERELAEATAVLDADMAAYFGGEHVEWGD